MTVSCPSTPNPGSTLTPTLQLGGLEEVSVFVIKKAVMSLCRIPERSRRIDVTASRLQVK